MLLADMRLVSALWLEVRVKSVWTAPTWKSDAAPANTHHVMIITGWHHAAQIIHLHVHTVTADRRGSDNTTAPVLYSCAGVCILKSEWCSCTVMKKAQLEEWISSLWNKSPGRKIICLCASNNPSLPCLLTTPHLPLLPCLSHKLGSCMDGACTVCSQTRRSAG